MKILFAVLFVIMLVVWDEGKKKKVKEEEKKKYCTGKADVDIPDDFMNLPIEEVNAKEFAEIFGMSNKEVYRMLKENEIKGARKENGRWYIPITRTENITRYERNLK